MKKRPVKKRSGHGVAPKYAFRLYVTGATACSTRAIRNLRKLCEMHLKDRYEIEVVDIYQQPALAQRQQIIAAPMLVKHYPPPLLRFIGDLSNTERILIELRA